MNIKIGALALTAILGIGFAAVEARAASPAGPSAVQGKVQPSVTEGVLQLVQNDRRKRMRSNWERNRDGRRCSRRLGECRHYRNGYYYETPWWTLPLIIGGGIAAQSMNDGYGNRGDAHVQWCRDRYRSYNVRTNTWVAYSGSVNQCNSPYN